MSTSNNPGRGGLGYPWARHTPHGKLCIGLSAPRYEPSDLKSHARTWQSKAPKAASEHGANEAAMRLPPIPNFTAPMQLIQTPRTSTCVWSTFVGSNMLADLCAHFSAPSHFSQSPTKRLVPLACALAPFAGASFPRPFLSRAHLHPSRTSLACDLKRRRDTDPD